MCYETSKGTVKQVPTLNTFLCPPPPKWNNIFVMEERKNRKTVKIY